MSRFRLAMPSIMCGTVNRSKQQSVFVTVAAEQLGADSSHCAKTRINNTAGLPDFGTCVCITRDRAEGGKGGEEHDRQGS